MYGNYQSVKSHLLHSVLCNLGFAGSDPLNRHSSALEA